MTKRRAENAVTCNAPCKRFIRSCAKIDTPLPGRDVACAVTDTPPLPTLPGNPRKRSLEEPGLQKTALPHKKSPADAESCTGGKCTLDNGPERSYGRFEQMSDPEPASAATPKRRREAEEVPHKMSKSEEGFPPEDDLSTFNSFQFWRVPLPSLDLSDLQSDGQEAARSISSEADSMET
ncbi:uncharacterized protein C9orf40 homolog [Brienomyrus brachyistius]|uniref:uncharacterized protein C9orf40 homolog n=1 Tax=Brienomyrus brachyistius TaxID=42636 RepID=UPI0020B3E976|nr:uncharacterized protein C9orf40 homolog [Brienomyrus brachyistius]